MWKTSLFASGVELDGGLRVAIEKTVRNALAGLEGRVGHVHVRVYGDVSAPALHTCYIRADAIPSGGVALGDTAAGIEEAVARAASRIASALRSRPVDGAWSAGPSLSGAGYGFMR